MRSVVGSKFVNDDGKARKLTSAYSQVEHDVVEVRVPGVLAWLTVLCAVGGLRPPVVAVVDHHSSPSPEVVVFLILDPLNSPAANQELSQPSAATIT